MQCKVIKIMQITKEKDTFSRKSIIRGDRPSNYPYTGVSQGLEQKLITILVKKKECVSNGPQTKKPR